MQEIFTEIRFCVADLKPGFSVINDMTQCKVGHLSELGTFSKAGDYLHSKEVGTVIRVVKKNQLVFNQISRVIDKKNFYPLIYVSTIEEAQEKLTKRLSDNKDRSKNPEI